MRRLVLLTILLTVGCAGIPGRSRWYPADCPPSLPATAAPYDTNAWREVAGRYRMVLVDTVNRRSWNPEGTRLELQPVDSAFRAYWEATDASHRRFVGRGDMSRAPAPQPVPNLVGVERTGDSVRVIGSVVFHVATLIDGYCGPGMCMDGSPTYFGFRYRTEQGYRGDWLNNMTGIGVLRDQKTGERLPNPAGYFCAFRGGA